MYPESLKLVLAMFDASAGWIIVTMVGLMAGCAAALIGKWFNRDTITELFSVEKVSHFCVCSDDR